MSIYTRTGDDGTTALFGGKRIPKSNAQIEAYGNVDELNSYIGNIASLILVSEVQEFLRTIQSDLFIVGSHLAEGKISLKTIEPRIKEMEQRMDIMDKTLPKLHSFILPGGSPLGSLIHVARSICRRAERKTVLFLRGKTDPGHSSPSEVHIIFSYLNRLSDFLFVLARFVNHQEHAVEVTWKGL